MCVTKESNLSVPEDGGNLGMRLPSNWIEIQSEQMSAKRTLYEGRVISNLVTSDSTKGCSFENLAYRVLQLQQVTGLSDQ